MNVTFILKDGIKTLEKIPIKSFGLSSHITQKKYRSSIFGKSILLLLFLSHPGFSISTLIQNLENIKGEHCNTNKYTKKERDKVFVR